MGLTEITEQNYQKEVVESALPVVIKFYDAHCDVCKLLSPVMDKVSKDYEGKAKFANCDRLAYSEIARKYGIQAASQIAVLYKGQKLGLIPGATVSTSGHGAAKEDFLKQRIDRCLEGIVKP